MFSSARRVCSLCAASDCRVGQEAGEPRVHGHLFTSDADPSRRVADAAAHRGAVDRSFEGVVAQNDPYVLDLVGFAEPAGPLDGDAVAQRVGELGDEELEHDAQVGAVGRQLRHGHAEIERVAPRPTRLHRHWPHRTVTSVPAPTPPRLASEPEVRPLSAGPPVTAGSVRPGLRAPVPSGPGSRRPGLADHHWKVPSRILLVPGVVLVGGDDLRPQLGLLLR